MEQFLMLWNKVPQKLKQMIGLILLTVLFFVLFCGWFYAKSFGAGIGEQTGQVVGLAVGSFNGITHGIQDGYADGREEGLSAEDTSVEVCRTIQTEGNLEILEADFETKKFLQSGDLYHALFSEKGKIVFTVDLESVTVEVQNGNRLLITIPMPHAELRMDESTCKQLAVYQEHGWTGSAQDGVKLLSNAKKEFQKQTVSEINSYEVLLENSIEAAKGTVQELAESVYIGKSISEIEVQCI